jgi:diguanylate cyclase (GGDEF)-like protein
VVIKTSLRAVRAQAVLVLVLVLGLAAVGSITLLERHVDASRQSQTEIAAMELHLVNLENAPVNGTQYVGGSSGIAAATIEADSRFISRGLRTLLNGSSPPPSIRRLPTSVRVAEVELQKVFTILAGSSSPSVLRQRLPAIIAAVGRLDVKASAALSLMSEAERVYSQRATQARHEAIIGSIVTILLLLLAFVVYYRRAWTARAENVRLLRASQDEAITDPLTGIGNRRAFERDLEQLLPAVSLQDELVVAMFDLDGFKQYNDTFGHAAGDALLARLAGSLHDTVDVSASAYRMGGDEFCVLAQTGIEAGDQLVHSAVLSLTDAGEGWSIGCSWGTAWMPSEATSASDALRLADERMYAQKAGRATAGYQATAALVQVLIERDTDLSVHIDHVAYLAAATARQLGLADPEITRIRLGAQLHDIGKTAIPESILSKPGPLDESEWEFMRRHTLIGERILTAAPSLAHTAGLVRSSHERIDGAGYPDRLAGAEIPLGSRIIAVCDAYDAMIVPRPYRDPISGSDAIAELRRCSGSQFDPDVVSAFCAILPGQAAIASPGAH